MKHILLTMAVLSAFSFAHAQSAQVVAKKVSGYEAYSEGAQINVYRFVGRYGGNYFAFSGDKPTIERKCNVVNGKCRGHATARAALREYVNEGFCQSPNWATLTCYSGIGGGDSARGDGSGSPDTKGHDGSRNPAGAGGGQGSGSGGINSNGGGGKSGSGGGSGNTEGSGGGKSGSGGGSGSGVGTGSGRGSGSGPAGNGGGSAATGGGKGGGGGRKRTLTLYHDANGYYADSPAPVCQKILKNKTAEQSQGGYNSSNRSCGKYWKVFEAQINVESETGCNAGKNQLRTTDGGTFSVVCTVKDAPTNDGSPSVGSLGGDDEGDKGGQSGGSTQSGGGGGGGRSGGSRGQTGGSLPSGSSDGGKSSDGKSSDGKSDGQSSSGQSVNGQSSDGKTGDAKSDKGDGDGDGKDYTSILESLYDKMTEAVDAIKEGFAKLTSKTGGSAAGGHSESASSQSAGGDVAQGVGKGGEGGKVKGKDGVKDDGKGKGQGTGKGESEGKDDGSAEDKGELPDGKSPEGGSDYPSNDFGKGKSTDLGSFSVSEYFSSNGTCPAPVSVDLAFIGTMEVTYDWFCRIAEIMRGVVIAFSWLAALYIIVKGES